MSPVAEVVGRPPSDGLGAVGDGRSYRLRSFPPHPALAPYVGCYRVLSAGHSGFSGGVNFDLPLWPRANTELCLVLGGNFVVGDGRGSFSADAGGGFVVGPKDRADRAGFCPGIEVINIGFAPGGATALLGIGAGEFAGRYLGLEDFGTPLKDLPPAGLLADTSDGEKVARVEGWLLRLLVRCGTSVGLNSNVAHALKLVDAADGNVSVRDLERELGRSRRTLERLFEDYVGVSPKGYSRLARLQRAKRMISAAPDGHVSLGLVARECGYHDQSHMTNEFRRVVGVTPAALSRLEAPDLVAFLQDPPELAV